MSLPTRLLSLLLLAVLAGVLAWRGDPAERPQRGAAPPGYTEAGAAMDYFIRQRLPPGSAELPVERYRQALERRAAMLQSQAGETRAKAVRSWRFLGPERVGGRTRALLIDPVEPETMYAGSASGGVWKSLDGGRQWSSTGDELANLAVASMALDPADHRTVYAGTGEGVYVGRPVSRSRGVRGDGIYLSTDGGAHWRQLEATRGRTDFDYVNALRFDFDGRLLAATRTGVWASSDGGASFRQLLAAPNAEGCSDLAVSTASRRLLVSCGMHSAGGVHVSSDAGATWTRTLGAADIGRSSLAVAPSNSAIVYALSADPVDYGMRRVSRSSDGGLNWEVRANRASDLATGLLLSNSFNANSACSAADSFAGQGWFDNALAVDPLNPDIVWAGGVDLYRSDDGGRRFRYASRWELDGSFPQYAHADQHVIVFHPGFDAGANTRLFVGNDGGVFETRTPYAATSANPCSEAGIGVVWTQRNQGYWATQFYHGSARPDGSALVAGAQDNGTHAGTPDHPDWQLLNGGDGGYSAVELRAGAPEVLYVSSQFANFRRLGIDGNVAIVNGLGARTSDTYLFITPLALDDNRPGVLYTGGQRLMRTLDQGTLWSAVSGVDPQGGLVSAIAIAPGRPEVVLYGTSSGLVARSGNATASSPTWLSSRPRQGFVSSITIDPADPQRVYATYANFGGSKVYRSSDGGATWVALDGSDPAHALPDIPAHTLLVDPRDPSRLLLGTDIGLFVGLEQGARWFADNSGLGNVLIEHLLAMPAADGGFDLTAFTYGRGAWRARLAEVPVPAVNPGLSGLWYEPATNGQGFQLEVNRATDPLRAGWYTYLPDSSPGSRSGLLWLYGSGAIVDGVAEFPVYRSRGGLLDAGGAASIDAVGTLRIAFADCSSALASYQLNLDGRTLSGEIPLTRLSADLMCERFRQLGAGAVSQLPLPAVPGGVQYGHGGNWYDPARPGQGFLVEADPQRGSFALSWYTYDPADPRPDGSQSPLWLIATGNIVGGSATATLYYTRGGRFDQPQPPAQAPVEAGTLRFTPQGCTAATIEYELRLPGAVERSGRIALQRLTPAELCR